MGIGIDSDRNASHGLHGQVFISILAWLLTLTRVVHTKHLKSLIAIQAIGGSVFAWKDLYGPNLLRVSSSRDRQILLRFWPGRNLDVLWSLADDILGKVDAERVVVISCARALIKGVGGRRNTFTGHGLLIFNL